MLGIFGIVSRITFLERVLEGVRSEIDRPRVRAFEWIKR